MSHLGQYVKLELVDAADDSDGHVDSSSAKSYAGGTGLRDILHQSGLAKPSVLHENVVGTDQQVGDKDIVFTV